MRRRTILLGGTAVAALAAGGAVLERAGLADDLARAAGVDPVAVPDPADERLLAAVAADHGRLVALAAAAPAVVREALAAQLAALGPAPTPGPVDALAPAALAAALTETSRRRSEDAARAVSPTLARILASVSAGSAVLAGQVGV